jgi:hypothetical protein
VLQEVEQRTFSDHRAQLKRLEKKALTRRGHRCNGLRRVMVSLLKQKMSLEKGQRVLICRARPASLAFSKQMLTTAIMLQTMI